MIGTTLGQYKILDLLGKGGMGEVYRARDSKLERDVAIKLLPSHLTADPERLARFEREAKVLASLNHPNIASVYGLEDSGGVPFLVMELVEGETLAERIAKGPVELEETMQITAQIAEGLAAAHESGIIHRDLKPANVKVTPEGRVKVLDFGLARAYGQETSGDPAESPTITADYTRPGTLLGTAAYMSPEQARGKTVDKKTDIWAFGCVLYEMLTGRRAFEGEDTTEMLAAIVRGDPNWSLLPSTTPASVRRLLTRSLVKDPTNRLHDIADARLELADADSTEEYSPASGNKNVGLWTRREVIAGGLLVASSSAATWLLSRGTSQPKRVHHHIVQVPGRIAMSGAESPNLAISPDGTLAYFDVATKSLYVKRVDEARPRQFGQTSGGKNPFFSYDGSEIGFGLDTRMKRVSVNGGPVRDIPGARLAYEISGAHWSRDRIVYRDGVDWHLVGITEDGGTPTLVTQTDVGTHLFPQVVDDGQQILYTHIGLGGLWEDAKVVLQALSNTADAEIVVRNGTYGRYVSGHIVYVDARGNLWALPYDIRNRKRRGTEFPVEENVRVALWGGAASFAVSETGHAAIVRGSNDERIKLKWRRRDGSDERPLGTPLAGGAMVSLSQDGKSVAMDITGRTNNDLWEVDASTGEPIDKWTSHPGYDWFPVWATDDRPDCLVYTSANDRDRLAVFMQYRDEPRKELFEATPGSDLWPCSWSRSGWLAYVTSEAGVRNIYARHVDRDGEYGDQITIAANPGVQDWYPQFSPDGNWVAYESGGKILVRSFSDGVDLDSEPDEVAPEGRSPRWSETDDRLELFYWKDDRRLYVQGVSTENGFQRGFDEALVFAEPEISGLHAYAIEKGGQNILVSTLNPDAAATEIEVILNWAEQLKIP